MMVRLPDDVHENVKRYAADDGMTITAWIEKLLAQEELRRRCEAHGRWMREHPEVGERVLVSFYALHGGTAPASRER